MAAIPESYAHLLESFYEIESLSVLVVAGKSRDSVAAVLEVDLGESVEDGWSDDVDVAAWAVVDIPGGVLAVETTGYGDPTRAALRVLSEGGGAAAVVRNNIQAHLRFGCASDGDLLVDADEYMYIEDPGVVPAELRPLFDLARDDLEDDAAEDGEGPDGFVVAMAMAELVTGIEVTADLMTAVYSSGFFKAPSLVYPFDR